MINSEGKKIERYIWGLSPHVKGLVIASRPTTYESAKQLAFKIVDQCIPDGKITPPTENKSENFKRGYHGKGKGDFKRHKPQPEQATVYATTANPTTPSNDFRGGYPQCTKCGRNHFGECLYCTHCKMTGHTVKYCRRQAPIPNVQNTGESRNCYECKQPGHIRRNCPKLRNQGGNGRAFVIGTKEAQKEPDVVTGTFLIDNLYATILFDTGADKSFISHKFRSMISHKACDLNEAYTVEVANGQVERTYEILANCILTLNNHPFYVNLIPITIGSFDVIIGMDWLTSHRAEILCHEKAVRLPLPNDEALMIYGDKSSKDVRLISCIKASKCLQKGCFAFLAHVVDTKKKTKELKDVPQVRDFPDVFPDELPGLPPARQVEFRIDLVPGAAPVARAPYRLAPSEMQELSSQIQE